MKRRTKLGDQVVVVSKLKKVNQPFFRQRYNATFIKIIDSDYVLLQKGKREFIKNLSQLEQYYE